MNTIEVFVKNSSGVYESIKDKANVTSFDCGELLDEQLDEARLIIKNSLVEIYPPLTEVKIEAKKDGVLKQVYYMIVGEDKPTEFNNKIIR